LRCGDPYGYHIKYNTGPGAGAPFISRQGVNRSASHQEFRIQKIRRYNFWILDSCRTTKRQILRGLEKILLGGFLGVLCVLAVNADLQFNREVAKDAKITRDRGLESRL
jgi:hypothetical protein